MTRADTDAAAGSDPPGRGTGGGPLRVHGPAAEVRVDASHARGVQIGDGGVQTNLFLTAAPAARSAYAHQVRAIAPPELLDRQPELAALAAFCTGPGDGGYLWWRAPAWAGKSALMAWFALHPPPGVRVVPFFVTGRFAGHGDRTGFTDVVLEQLADLLDRPLPAHLSEATRGPHLTGLLADAAALCRDRGERLVLLVDGLDEDRGAVAGPDVHSVAALLPVRPPHGLRVVVAGRPDPPLPADVPDAHPLRSAAVVRVLGASPHAQVVRRDAERELRRLLHGSPAEQDLLGLVTASGGGLRAADLAELTGLDRWRVDEQLEAATARTFTRRGAPDGYLLAHEELQAAAVRFLEPRLDAYRERLRAWADTYRGRGWPAETPDYLLRGYAAMLADAGPATELSACATDRARHARLLARTGADAAALAEIGAAQDAVLAQEPVDLRTLGVLAVHHGLLSTRNLALPTALPAVWAVLGDFPRARALAGSVPEAGARAGALTDLVRRAADAGQDESALRLAERVRTTVRGVENAYLRDQALVRLATVLAGAGLVERAKAVADTLTEAGLPHAALLGMAEALARTGRDAPLRDLIEEHARPEQREAAWRRVAEVWADRGRIADTERLAASLTTRARAFAYESLAGAQARAGQYAAAEATAALAGDGFVTQRILKGLALHLAGAGSHARAEALVDRLTEPMLRMHGLEQLAALAAAGPPDLHASAARLWARARALADAQPDAENRVRAWTSLVRNAAPAAGPEEARRLADRAEALARTLKGPYRAAHALSALTEALVHAGAHDRAEALLRTLSGYNAQETRRRSIAAAVRQGDLAWAEALVGHGDGAGARDHSLRVLVRALREQGLRDRATSAARTLRSQPLRAEALAELALAAAEAGEHRTAAELAAEAERDARSARDAEEEGRSLAALLRGLSAGPGAVADVDADAAPDAGPGVVPDVDAGVVADSGPGVALGVDAGAGASADVGPGAALDVGPGVAPSNDPGGVFGAASGAVPTGDPGGARGAGFGAGPRAPRSRVRLLAGRTDAVAARLVEEHPRGEVLAELVEALYRAGEHGAVTRALRGAPPDTRATALTALVRAAARAGRPRHVEVFAAAALDAARSARVEPETAPYLVIRIAAALDRAGAESLLGTVTDPVAHVRGWADLVARASSVGGDLAWAERLADRAEAAVDGLPGANALDEALLGLAEALAAAGAHARAEAIARPLLHPYARDVATIVRLRAAAARRDWAELDRLAGTMRSRSGTLRTMASLAAVAAGEGDVAGVREFVRVATVAGVGPEEWEGLVGPVVGALAAAGEATAAEALAEGVPFPGGGTRVRVALARVLEPDRARPLLARALREGDWREAADALGLHRPDAVEAMTDAYLDGTS
ncbi:hypothetical protein ACIQKB_02555 [Streptomyces sp. NPDC092046]|uniref:hypothetical protein n=1 Tax=Streptomyces sp. NPDC092046 TaxID=3366009 RepID=UPI00380B78C3